MPLTAKPSKTEPPAVITAISRNLVRDVHAPYAARRFVRAQLRTWNLPGLVDTLELVANELAANAVEHGTGNFIAVRLELCSDAVTVKVWDANADRMPKLPDPAAADLEEHGRGLLLTDALSTQWGAYRSPTGGKVAWATCS